jgi:hypothetical protein
MVCLRKAPICFAAALMLGPITSAHAEPEQIDTVQQVFAKLKMCWRAARGPSGSMDVAVRVSFTRDGQIQGRPKITHESEQASDDDRLRHRIAVMETLQRCTPLPFTEGLGGAIAGRPFVIRFSRFRKPPPQPAEKRAWLTTTTL